MAFNIDHILADMGMDVNAVRINQDIVILRRKRNVGYLTLDDLVRSVEAMETTTFLLSEQIAPAQFPAIFNPEAYQEIRTAMRVIDAKIAGYLRAINRVKQEIAIIDEKLYVLNQVMENL